MRVTHKQNKHNYHTQGHRQNGRVQNDHHGRGKPRIHAMQANMAYQQGVATAAKQVMNQQNVPSTSAAAPRKLGASAATPAVNSSAILEHDLSMALALSASESQPAAASAANVAEQIFAADMEDAVELSRADAELEEMLAESRRHVAHQEMLAIDEALRISRHDQNCENHLGTRTALLVPGPDDVEVQPLHVASREWKDFSPVASASEEAEVQEVHAARVEVPAAPVAEPEVSVEPEAAEAAVPTAEAAAGENPVDIDPRIGSVKGRPGLSTKTKVLIGVGLALLAAVVAFWPKIRRGIVAGYRWVAAKVSALCTAIANWVRRLFRS